MKAEILVATGLASHTFKLEKSFDVMARAAENHLEVNKRSNLKTLNEGPVPVEIKELKEALDLFVATRQLMQASV